MMKNEWKEKIKKWLSQVYTKLKNFWRRYRINKLVVLVSLIGVLIGSSYLVYLAKTADVENLRAGLEQTTVVYDRYGQEAGELYSQKGTFTTLQDISPYIQDAVISTEDKRFYTHKGVDPIGIARAAVGIVLNRGAITGGGSTITQQLAKNAYLTLDQTLIRKAKELFLAFEIEKKYEKEEILEMYLNNSYFGNGVWGVEDASQKYFGKSASEVTLSEAAVLTAMLKGPSLYNPIDDYEASINRRDTVLQLMADNGFTDQATADAAMAEGIYLYDNYASYSSYNYPYYFDAVIEEAVYTYGIDEEDLLNRGYKIYTGLDQDYQYQMDQTYDYAYFIDGADGTLMQSASVAIEPSTGDVLAMVGGRGEHTFRGFNRATQMSVPPASTIKPLSIYTPALEAGYDVDSMIMDDDTLTYGPTDYALKNYDRYSEYAEIPMYRAIVESKNTTAVYLLDKMGIDKAVNKLAQFGIPVREEDKIYGDIALGDMDGVSPLQMASAYSTFANDGLRADPRIITKIVDATGAVVVDNTAVQTTRVVSSEIANKMTSILLGVYAPGGTGYGAQPYNGMQVAGKTGTSEAIGEDGPYDRTKWMIAYTPDITVATWIGFDETTEENNLSDIGMMFYNLFSNEMGNLLNVSPSTTFAVGTVDEELGNQTPESSWVDRVDGFIDQFTEFGGKVEEKSKEWFNRAVDFFR